MRAALNSDRVIKRRRISLRGVVCLLAFAISGLLIANIGVVYRSFVVPESSSIRSSHTPRPDGSFNKVPIYLRTAEFHSSVHCIGETHDLSTAWMYRSCKFHNLCFDTSTTDFFLVKSPVEQKYQEHRMDGSFVSTSMLQHNMSLALGGINPRWQGTDFNQGIDKVKWFPNIVDEPPAQYFSLPDNMVLLPFHSFAAHNVGHLLWDDFYPMYLLLGNFGLLSLRKLLLRVDTLPLLYGTCEMRPKKKQKCADNFEKFLPLFGVDPRTFTTTKHSQLNPVSPSVVCAKTAVAGLGMLTDHGLNDHGWNPSVETTVQNVGKGVLFYQFRNFMLRNLGLPIGRAQDDHSLFRIVLSAHSSSYKGRNVDFAAHYDMIHQAYPIVDLHRVELASMTVMEQVHLVSQTNIFVSVCGGGTMTATFLPRGATLILFYHEQGGFEFSNMSLVGGPAFLDWDLFNNAAHLHVHWLPIGSMNTPEGIESFKYLIRHEIDVPVNAV